MIVHYLRQQHKRKAKEQADFSRKYSKANPLKKLDWDVTDKRILFEQVRHCLGSPLHLGARGKLPLLPPPPCRRHWFQTYLSGRRQRVCIGKVNSPWLMLGVPQGSILMFVLRILQEILYSTAKLRNSLPSPIRTLTDIGPFTRACKAVS